MLKLAVVPIVSKPQKLAIIYFYYYKSRLKFLKCKCDQGPSLLNFLEAFYNL